MGMPINTRRAADLASDEEGVTLVEFAILAPVLLLMLMGLFDMAHTQYTSAMINGAIQKAARDITLESAASNESQIDQLVIDKVSAVAPASATITLEKTSYDNLEDVAEEEEFTDDNGDGICNQGEPFVDANGNGQWDADRGTDGIGSAHDAVLYTAIVSYDRLFPMYGLAGMPQEVELRASTVLRNQPYDADNDKTGVGNCD